MPAITYVSSEGERQAVDVPAGTTIKDAAVDNGVAGILAECGGNAMCATCHVYVDPGWWERLPPMDEVEDDLLGETASPREPTSRLGCQVCLTDELDGIVVRLSAEQA